MSVGKYTPIKLKFNRGVVSHKDPSLIPINAMAEAINIVLDKEGSPTKIEGRQPYNAELGTNKPTKGQFSWIAEDSTEYLITLTNNRIYWSSGSGTETIVKYKNETGTPEVVVNTDSYWYNMTDFDVAGSKVVYLHSDDYPASDTTDGTENKRCSISRAIMLYVSGGVVYAKNVYYDDTGALTPGLDDIEAGSGALEIGFPKGIKYSGTIVGRLVGVNYFDAKNGWIASEQDDSLDWTNADGSANSGAGQQPEEFSGAFFSDTFFLCYTRTKIMRVDVTPGEISNWRESWLQTKYGNVGRNIVLHTDGLIYFVSEKGICRTDGRTAEKVDLAIENQIKDLAQLKQALYSWILSTQTDFDAGTPAQIVKGAINTYSFVGGTGYAIGDILTVVQAGASGGTFRVDSVSGLPTNAVVTMTKITQGSAYDVSVNSPTTVSPSGGTGCTISVLSVFNNNLFDTTGGILKQKNQALFTWDKNVNDIAYGKTVTTSSNYSGTGALVVDGDDDTYWQSNESYAPYCYVDFGSNKTVKNVRIKGLHASGSTLINWQYSTNGTDWTTFKSTKTSETGYYANYNDATGFTARYIRIISTRTSGDPVFLRMYKLSVYESDISYTGAIDYGVVTPANYGNLSAYVYINSYPDLAPGTVTTYPVKFYISTSADGSTWDAPVLIGTQSTTGAFTGVTTGISTKKRYIKIGITGLFNDLNCGGEGNVTNLYVGGQWISATKDLSIIPLSWGIFSADVVENGQTFILELSTSANGSSWDDWQVVTPGTVPTGTAGTPKRYVRIRVTLSTANYTLIPYLNETTLKYYSSGGANSSLPALASFEERLYICFASNGVTYNNHAWIGMTSPEKGIEYRNSPYISGSYPEWTKCDFMNYNQFCLFQGLFMGGSSQKGILYTEKMGDDNGGTAFISYFLTSAISTEDAESIWRMLFVFSKAVTSFNFYYRTRKDTNDWGSWSTAKVVPATSFVAKSAKYSFQGSLVCDFVQFKIEAPLDDLVFALISLYVYYSTKPAGR